MIPVQYRALAAGLGLLLAMSLAGAAGWLTNGWRRDAEIAELQRAHAETMRSQSELALTTLQADVERITTAATEFATIQSTLAPRMSALTKELRNVRNVTPLPADCKPTPDRVRNLDAAIDAANKSIPR
jgi:hypothetical protein